MSNESSIRSFYDEAKIKFNLPNSPLIALDFPLAEIFLALEHSPFANSLQERNRFKPRFFFADYGDTEEIWVKWVEPFSSLIEHQKDFTHWSLAFHGLEGDRYSPREQMLGILADAIHDLGEVKIEGQEFLGDIPSGNKTSNDETKEAQIAHAAIDGLEFGSGSLIRSLLHLAYDEVVVGKNEKLHKAHKAREKWDYVRTGIHLFRLAISNESFYTQFPIYSLDWFITRILAYDLPKICKELAPEYPSSIGHELNVNFELISGAFARSQFFLEQVMAGKSETKISDDFKDLHQRLDSSYQLWQTWVHTGQSNV